MRRSKMHAIRSPRRRVRAATAEFQARVTSLAPGLSILSATKAAVRSLVRSLGAEFAPRGIRVNAVSPGPISTPFHGKLGLSEEQLNETASAIEDQVPLHRFGEAGKSPRRPCS
jgi:NAD(P)-dependent dehydrogenase (short-subunit alcohol dehydrogenase family)